MPLLPAWAWAALLGAALLSTLVLAQGKLLFGRTWRIRRAGPGPAAARRRAELVCLPRPGGVRLLGWLTLPTAAPPRRLLIWFGGRNEHVAWTPDLAGWLPDDCALLAFNYRGMGGSSGWPGETACVADAEAIAAWALRRLALPPEALHLAGRSLGSAVALQLAARRSSGGCAPASIALITPPLSVRALVARQPLLRPLAPLLRSPLDSADAARDLACDVLMLLAERDRQVPHAHSLRLAEALGAAGCAVTVQRLPGTNHRSLARTTAAMRSLGGWLPPAAGDASGR